MGLRLADDSTLFRDAVVLGALDLPDERLSAVPSWLTSRGFVVGSFSGERGGIVVALGDRTGKGGVREPIRTKQSWASLR